MSTDHHLEPKHKRAIRQWENDRLHSEIDRLEAEIARLRAALEKIGNPDMYVAYDDRGPRTWIGGGGKGTPAEFARKALDGKP